MNLYEWAARWGIDGCAITELREEMGLDGSTSTVTTDATTEAGVQSRVRLDMARNGAVMWRNNVGAMQDPETGRVVRYGLANESKRMNEQFKSSDLIGVTPVEILPGHIGMTLGVFTAIETKAPGWIYRGTPREQAQKRYIDLVVSKGGIARFMS